VISRVFWRSIVGWSTTVTESTSIGVVPGGVVSVSVPVSVAVPVGVVPVVVPDAVVPVVVVAVVAVVVVVGVVAVSSGLGSPPEQAIINKTERRIIRLRVRGWQYRDAARGVRKMLAGPGCGRRTTRCRRVQ
jgi:hypothetical protein